MSNVLRDYPIDTMWKSQTENQFIYFHLSLVISLTIKDSINFVQLEIIMITRILNKSLRKNLLNIKLAQKTKKNLCKSKFKSSALR